MSIKVEVTQDDIDYAIALKKHKIEQGEEYLETLCCPNAIAFQRATDDYSARWAVITGTSHQDYETIRYHVIENKEFVKQTVSDFDEGAYDKLVPGTFVVESV